MKCDLRLGSKAVSQSMFLQPLSSVVCLTHHASLIFNPDTTWTGTQILLSEQHCAFDAGDATHPDTGSGPMRGPRHQA